MVTPGRKRFCQETGMPSLRGFSIYNLPDRGLMTGCLDVMDVMIKIGLSQGKSRLQESLCVHLGTRVG